MIKIHYCKICETDTNFRRYKRNKRFFRECKKCGDVMSELNFIKRKRKYDNMLFTEISNKLLEDKNLRFLVEK